MQPTQELIDDIYREKVERARQMSFDEKLLGGLVLFDNACELAKAGFDPVYGAWPLKRAIQAQLENPLAKAILEGKFAAKDVIRVDVNKGGAFVFDKVVLH